MLIKGLGEAALIFPYELKNKTFTTGNGIMLFDSGCNRGCWTKTNNPFQILRKKEHIWDRLSPVHEKTRRLFARHVDGWRDLHSRLTRHNTVDRPISERHDYTVPLRGIVTMEWDAAFTWNSKDDLVGFMKQYKSTLSFLIHPKSLLQSWPPHHETQEVWWNGRNFEKNKRD